MGEPAYIQCNGLADLPPVEDLLRRVSRDARAVLVFPAERAPDVPAFNPGEVIRRLEQVLPEDVIVFEAWGKPGAHRVTLLRVIPTADVVENEAAICAAARAFREVATGLVHALATKLNLPIDAFSDPLLRMTLGDRDEGRVDAEWAYSFHGTECRFTHDATGQVVEVTHGFGTEFGVLDPYFFHKFVTTTAAFAPVAALFRNSFHDPLRALEILDQRGRMRRVVRPLTGCEGLVATDGEGQRG